MDEARKLLVDQFKLNEFRNHQEDVISRLLVDNENALAIMPTGSGKSLCYQLPALCFEGLTLVISPLLALMKDQVDSLVRRGIKAGRFDSSQSTAEYQETVASLRSGELKILYVAPERLNMEGFMGTISQFTIELLAVDESHCVSEWGDAFRPDYLKIARFAKEHNVKRTLCLTATATTSVAEDVCRAFDIGPKQGVFRAKTYRNNLQLCINSIGDDPEGSQRLELVVKHLRQFKGASIIYVTSQKNCEKVAEHITSSGIEARAYHAGMRPEVRKETQDWFMKSATACVCATIAFGMGIDKSNIRSVVHFNMPKTLEGYSQEVGRAGRDGVPSRCVLYLSSADRSILENFARGNTPSRKSVQAFVTQVCIDAKVQGIKVGGALEIYPFEYSKNYDIRDVTLSLLFAQLELRFGFFRAITPAYKSFEYKRPKNAILYNYTQKDSSPAAKIIHEYAKFGKTQFTIDVGVAAQARGVDRSLLVEKLQEWSDSGWIDLKCSQRWNRYRLEKELPKKEAEIHAVADQMYTHLEKREQDEVARMERVFTWAADSQCLAKGLASYFGDTESFPGKAVCGLCTVCVSGKPATTYKYIPPPFDEFAYQKVLQFCEVHDDARFLARVAFGITSPRISALKLSSNPNVFGIMSNHEWEDLLERFEKVVEAWLIENPDGAPGPQAGSSRNVKPKAVVKAPVKRKASATGSSSGWGQARKKTNFR
ncbi:hypothetical protein FRB94_002748 [Tulasnella sp. JGI-2019a]|nr:hypothetical protein FRB94_002748 [Tulasnella sp. JGI-2019a]KAG9013319.1 hypothetical protein FRB93_000842 [Tulasnella sp. JGI-2019a]